MILFTLASFLAVLVYTVLTFHPLPNVTFSWVCRAVIYCLFLVFIRLADNCYDKLKTRIQTLEDRLDDMDTSVTEENPDEAPIYTQKLCRSCRYDIEVGDLCGDCDDCDMSNHGMTSCYCCTIVEGEPCERYTPKKKEDTNAS